jgi:hypothetical protein
VTTIAPIAVVFLLRWADASWRDHAARFVESYAVFEAGLDHRLYIALKGFETEAGEAEAAAIFAGVPHRRIVVPEAGRDIGAYLAMSRVVDEPRACFLNSHSRILCRLWLSKLNANLDLPGVGLVGASGSYESLHMIDAAFPAFPNPHLRTNGFMLDVSMLHAITADVAIEGRQDAFLFESGPLSMTNRVLARGLRVLTVGRNGRGYDVDWWPWSEGFRQGLQTNLLIGDNQTRHFDTLQRPEREQLAWQSWGRYRSRAVLPGR